MLVKFWPCLDTLQYHFFHPGLRGETGSSPFIPSLPEGDTSVSRIHFMESSCSRTLFCLSLLPLHSPPSLHNLKKRGFSPCDLEASKIERNRRFLDLQAYWIYVISQSVLFQIIAFRALIPYRLVEWHGVSGHNSVNLEEGVMTFLRNFCVKGKLLMLLQS
jgi:hypothetical protein